MDPNVVLERMQEALKVYRDPNSDELQRAIARETIIDAADDLNDWLKNEGFPPDAWFGAWHRSIGEC